MFGYPLGSWDITAVDEGGLLSVLCGGKNRGPERTPSQLRGRAGLGLWLAKSKGHVSASTTQLVVASVQIGDNNSSHLTGLLGGLNELRGVKPLDQPLAPPPGSPTAASDASGWSCEVVVKKY